MRISFSAEHGVRAGKLLATIIASTFLWACSGSDGNSDANAHAAPATPATPATPSTPSAKANAVSASVEESGDVLAYVGKSASITVDFSTAEGTVTALKLDPPADPGWQSVDGQLGCDSIAPKQACKLRLRYAPNAPAASATLKLSYRYVDSAGNARSDNLSVNYRALAANAATATMNPAGTVNAVVGVASSVSVNFGTNDGSAASKLHVDLSALPSGWSGSASAFDCASFGGNACQLQLVYQPSASAAPSSFDLPYSYVDSAGDAQAGKLTFAYAAAAANSVFANALPASRVAVTPGASRDVSFSFVPSDGQTASAVKLSDGYTLPAGWSIKSSTLPCATVNADGRCQLVLTYSPTASLPAQALDLGFDYVNAIGQAQHGTASVSYSSRIYSAYVADFYAGSASAGGGLLQCEAGTDGALQNCAQVASAWPAISTNRIIVSGSRAYVTTNLPSTLGTRALSVCDVDIDGSLINCANAGASFDGIISFAVTGQYAYLISPISSSAGSLNRITRCTLDGRGQVPQDSCAQLPFETTGTVVPSALAAFKSAVYVAAAVDITDTGARLLRCVPSPTDATQTTCRTFTATYPQSVQGLAGASLASGDYLYLLSANNSVSPGTGAIVKCTLAPDGSISGCDGGKLPGGVAATDLALSGDIAIVGKLAYITVTQGNLKGILSCPIDDATGDLGACVSAGDTGANMPFDITLR